MGTQNLKEYINKIAKFKDSKCPICNNGIEIDNTYKLEVDCIHYKCPSCSPKGCMISISGSVLATNNFDKILNDDNIKNYLKEKIKNCLKDEVFIQMSDFRP